MINRHNAIIANIGGCHKKGTLTSASNTSTFIKNSIKMFLLISSIAVAMITRAFSAKALNASV